MMMVLVVLEFNIILLEFRSENIDITLVAVHASHQSLILLHESTYCVPVNEQQGIILVKLINNADFPLHKSLTNVKIMAYILFQVIIKTIRVI